MIFVTHKRNEHPVFTGFINSVWERDLPGGGKIPMYNIGTGEKRQDGTRIHSSWVCDMIGPARREAEINPVRRIWHIESRIECPRRHHGTQQIFLQ